MSLYTLFLDNVDYAQGSMDYKSSNEEFTLDTIVKKVKVGQQYLQKIPIEALISFFQEACQYWSCRDNEVQKQLGAHGLNFLLYWLKEQNLRKVIEGSLRIKKDVLDGFVQSDYAPYEVFAHPKGLVGHWLSGNVPMLGVLSLVQGILTKNANILKVSSQNPWMLPLWAKSISEIEHMSSSGVYVEGNKLAQSIAVIYFESHQKKLHEALSRAVQVRVAWGGAESVESVMNIPRRYGTDDIIFGPKTSLSVIGKECLVESKQAETIARFVAADIMAFDQQGCNAPHTLFIERGGAIKEEMFAEILAGVLTTQSDRNIFNQPAAQNVFKILSLRTEYDMRGVAHYSDNFDWTVLYAELDEGLADPCYYRTLFIRPIDDIAQVVQYCSHWTQSVGVALSRERKRAFSKELVAAGVDRIPDIGRMNLYETPWDGMFVMDRLVRWSKLDYSYDFAPTPTK